MGFVLYGIPLILSYLHGSEQVLLLLSQSAQSLVDGAHNHNYDPNLGVVQAGLIGGIIKSMMTHDTVKIEEAVNATTVKAVVAE